MNHRKTLVLSLAASCLLAHGWASAQSAEVLPTHCTAAEVSLLDASMGTMRPDGTGSKLVKNGKLLSLCADKSTEPLGSLTYRYGRVGAVELAQTATPSHKFGLYEAPGMKVGHVVLSFSKGGVDYHVAESIGMGLGVSLYVFKSGKKLADLFSGTQEGVDFKSSLSDLQFDKPASPIFELRKPGKEVLNAL